MRCLLQLLLLISLASHSVQGCTAPCNGDTSNSALIHRHCDGESGSISDGNGEWSKGWEKLSHNREKPNHIPGWTAGDHGSLLEEPDYMSLGGPWVNGDPAVGA